MQDVLFFLIPLAWFLFFSSCFYLIGQVINEWLLGIQKQTGLFFLNSVMGMCYTLSVLFVLALLNGLTVVSVLVVVLAPIIVALVVRPSVFRLQWDGVVVKKHYALVAILLAFWLSVAIRVFLPESGADALSYHLPYAKSFAEAGGLVLEPYLRYPLNTLNFNLLFTLGFLFEGEILARMFSLYAGFLMVTGIYSVGLVFFDTVVATVAAWLFISSQLILNIMTMAYIDVGFGLFILAAVFALLYYQKQGDKHYLSLLVIFLGVAMGTKYLGLLVVPSILAWLFLITQNKKQWATCVLMVLVVASPWYIRSWLISGNPIHPFGQAFFGYWLWTPLDMVHQNNDLFSVHGVERNWHNLVKLPWLIWQDTFVRIGPLNALFALSMPLALLGLCKPGVVRQFSLFVLLHVVFWFYSSQIMRYLIFAMPFLSLLTAYFVVRLIQYLLKLIPRPKRLKWSITDRGQHILGLVVVFICAYSALKYHYKVISKDMVPDSQHEWQVMLQKNPEYQLVNAANQQSGEATMKLGFPYVAHYFEHDVKGDFFGAANMVEFSKKATDDERLRRIMQEMNVRLLLIDKSYERFVKVHQTIKNSERFTLILENERGYLYRRQ